MGVMGCSCCGGRGAWQSLVRFRGNDVGDGRKTSSFRCRQLLDPKVGVPGDLPEVAVGVGKVA